MAEGNYENILLKVSKSSGIDREELERKVEAKRAKLSGLISREGAMQIIASELGVNFDNEKLKIDELLPGMRKVNIVGKIINLSPVRTFERNGKEGKVVNMIIADESSNVKAVLWDVNHIELIEKGDIGSDSVVEIINGAMRGNELHLGSFSEIKKSLEKIENVNSEKRIREAAISEFRTPDSVGVRAFIVQAFEPRFFEVCPECKKKATDGTCATHGSIVPEKRAVMNIVIDDGTESIRTVLFHDMIFSIGLTDLENVESQILQRQNLLGKEMFFSGEVRNNSYFNNSEFIVNQIREIVPSEILEKLENK